MNDEDDKFTLGDAVCFAWYNQKRLEHSYIAVAWDLSLEPDIQADCMEHLSTHNDNLREFMGDVVSMLYYPPSPNKNDE